MSCRSPARSRGGKGKGSSSSVSSLTKASIADASRSASLLTSRGYVELRIAAKLALADPQNDAWTHGEWSDDGDPSSLGRARHRRNQECRPRNSSPSAPSRRSNPVSTETVGQALPPAGTGAPEHLPA